MSTATGSPPSSPLALDCCGNTHPGCEREDNEDAFGIFPESRLFIVADGMGGRAAGAVAARLAIDEVEGFFRKQHASPRSPWPFAMDKNLSLGANLLCVAAKVANQKLREAAAANPAYHRMGATLAALAVGETQVITAHVGDARVYRLRGGALVPLTRDHSLIEEMRAARPDMSAEELQSFAHRNVVTRALGTREQVEPTVSTTAMERGDLYLLCSDGLWASVADETMAGILRSTKDLEAAAQLLVDAANDAGGPDNITAVLVQIA
jgi:serine/threonine protein phosphatase PrpC